MKFFKRFFNKYFVIGFIIILFSIIFDLKLPDCFWKLTIVNALNTIGVALLIGSIFDFSKNSDDFMNSVRTMF